jgi:hypothetical protein
VNSLIIPGQLNRDRTLRDSRVRCIACAALHRPFPLYFLFIWYMNTANNNSTETREEIRAHNVLRGSSWLDPNIN